MGFSEWFKGQSHRTDAVGKASVEWFKQTGEARRGRVSVGRLQTQGGIAEATAKKIFEEYQAAA